MSLGVTGTVRDYEIPALGSTTNEQNYTGSAVAVDLLIPIVPASDNQSSAGTLTLTSEFSTGQGYGDE